MWSKSVGGFTSVVWKALLRVAAFLPLGPKALLLLELKLGWLMRVVPFLKTIGLSFEEILFFYQDWSARRAEIILEYLF
jgi:hypothetical protein